jgi:DNA polymerase I-like protein with 3'-5' exonuclease and polymerase domains
MMTSLMQKNCQFKVTPALSNDTFLVFDLESDGLYDKVTVVHCIVIHDITKQKTFTYGPESIANALNHLETADVLIGHNIIFYDLPVLEKLHNFKFNKQTIDTLVCSRLIWPKEVLNGIDDDYYPQVPGGLKGSPSLKAWGYRLSDHKIEFKDFSQYSEEMAAYCRQDVNVTYKLWEKICKQNYALSALELEHRFAWCINKQIKAGIPFDTDAALDLVDKLRTKQKELEEKLKEVFPPIVHQETFIPKVNNAKRGYVKGQPFVKTRVEEFNPGSRQQIADRLKQKYNWKSERTTEKGNPILDDDVLEKLPYPEAKLLAEYMLIKKRLGQIADGNNAWLKLVNNDTGRMHGDLITNGCITGRCAHRNPNMGQVPASYSPYGKECRSLFHAPQGWSLIGIDAKALELRCLAGYLARFGDTNYAKVVIDPEADIHTYNQEMFGVATRDISKRLLYGLLYGCGSLKAGTIIDSNEKNEAVLRKLGSTAINSFMRGVPALQKLKDGIDEKITERNYLLGLDRRVLHCRSAFKGLNVLLQSAGAIIMKQVVVNIHDNIEKNLGLVHGKDWEQMLMVHDEVQLACKPEYVEQIKEQALISFVQAGKYFDFACPIEGDAKVGFTWEETH